MFRKIRSSELPLHRPADTAPALQVLETIERTNLDPEQVLLVGSAALTLYGLILSSDRYSYPQDAPNRPGDVDILSTASYAESVYKDRVHEGLAVELNSTNKNSSTILQIHSSPLPVDLITLYKGYGSMKKFDEKFLAKIAKDSHIIEGMGGIRIATAEKLKEELAGRTKDPKAKMDLVDFQAHMQKRS